MADRRNLQLETLNEKERYYWDNIAPVEPSSGEVIPLHHIPKYQELIEDFIFPLQGKKVIEIGCNTGGLCYFFANKGADITGVDISAKCLEVARRTKPVVPVKGTIDFVEGTAENLPFEDDTFDIFFARHVMHHTAFNMSLSECKRVVKPQGKIVLIETTVTNPVVRISRYGIPGKFGTKTCKNETEYPLTTAEIRYMKKEFDSIIIVGVGFFRLLLRIPFFGGRKWSRKIFSFLDDCIFLRTRWFSPLSYEKIFLITNVPG